MIVVTGGSGFIGTHLCLRLLGLGYDVRILDVKEPRLDTLREHYVYTDITDGVSVLEECRDASIVYHLAGNPVPRIAEYNPQWNIHVNVCGTLNVIRACLKYGARLVFTSTIRVLDRYLTNYSISKYTCELYIQKYGRQGLEYSIARLNNVYGELQSLGTVVTDLIHKAIRSDDILIVRGSGRETREFIYVSDAVDALLTISNHTGCYDIGTGREISILELARTIVSVSGRSLEIQVTDPNATPMRGFRVEPDYSKIESLGWTPRISLEEGIRRVYRWMSRSLAS